MSRYSKGFCLPMSPVAPASPPEAVRIERYLTSYEEYVPHMVQYVVSVLVCFGMSGHHLR